MKCTPQPTVVMVEGMMEGQGTIELLQFTHRHILHNRGEKERIDLSQSQTDDFNLTYMPFKKKE